MPVGFGRDIRRRAGRLDLPADGVAVVAFVGLQDAAGGQALEKQGAGLAIGDVPARQQEGDRPAEPVGQGVDLGRPASARVADRLILLPPFPPDAERCAFTAELSISPCAGDPPAVARSWKSRTQTPLIVQRMKRL